MRESVPQGLIPSRALPIEWQRRIVTRSAFVSMPSPAFRSARQSSIRMSLPLSNAKPSAAVSFVPAPLSSETVARIVTFVPGPGARSNPRSELWWRRHSSTSSRSTVPPGIPGSVTRSPVSFEVASMRLSSMLVLFPARRSPYPRALRMTSPSTRA